MQQINLYQPIFKQQEKVFSAKTLLQAGLVVLSGLLIVYGYAIWQTMTLEKKLTEFEQQRQQATARLLAVGKQFPPPQRDAALEQQLETARRELAARQRLVAVLDKPTWGRTDGFAAELEALARQKPDQLWLRELALLNGGRDVVLQGSTYAPEQVPQYLQRLNQEPALKGTEFARFLMERSEEQPRRVDFTLDTRPAPDGEAGQ